MKRRWNNGLVMFSMLFICVVLLITWRSLSREEESFPVLAVNDIRLSAEADAIQPLPYVQ
ncbi:MAG: hypothetical protein K0Q73_8617, partial [Paenibacillus sp.]|nr:hypothetical protein [Paenibacillus sp.]